MRSAILPILVTISLLFIDSTNCLAEVRDSVANDVRLQRIENTLAEVRRDQLNYRIEKDLLKDAFSSNYQTINIVLAIVLGVFSIVGFLGIRDVGAIKKEYLGELERVNSLRKDLELKVKQIGEQQDKVQGDYLEIMKTNDEQSRRIKVLELQEKISSLMQSKNYQRALEYVAAALALDPDNTILLDQKATSLWKLNDLEGAILTYKELLKYDPENKGAMANLLELFLLAKRIPEYQDLYGKNSSWVDQKDDRRLTMYFDLLQKYQLGKEEEMETLMSQNMASLSAEKDKPIGWQFGDVTRFLDSRPDSRGKTLLKAFVGFLGGSISKNDAAKLMEPNATTS